MRIYTYSNPFKIDENTELWELMNHCPQLCASDTLAQGLARKYGRRSFQYLRSIDHLFEKFYGKWTNNTLSDMSIHLCVSEEIGKIEDENVARVFKNNIQYVIESIKFLLILGVDERHFSIKNCTAEQRVLLLLYAKLKEHHCFRYFRSLKSLKKQDLVLALRLGIADEMMRELDDEDVFKGMQGEALIEAVQSQAYAIISNQAKGARRKGLIGSTNLRREKLQKLEYLTSLLEVNLIQSKKIIVHGIHRLTPMMLFFFNQVKEEMGIEIIFTFNYCKQLPHIYGTWERIYSWTKSDWRSESDELLELNPVGERLASIMEGKESDIELEEKLIKYENMTHFSHSIAKVYDEAIDRVDGKTEKVLSHMEVQYYATNADKSNNVLKMYYPNQFGERQFLAYPIGQFIISLYKMWDFKENQLHIEESALKECLQAGILLSDQYKAILATYEKIKNYFIDLVEDPSKFVGEYVKRIEVLKGNLEKVQEDELLNAFSFFSVSVEEANQFKKYILELNEVAEQLFKDMNEAVQYNEHFKRIIETLSKRTQNNLNLSKLEQELIENVQGKLAQGTTEKVSGLKEDLKGAMFLFLSQRKNDKSSKWIVRGFEQLDGTVLLSETSRAKRYHIGLVSENNMGQRVNEALSWPLTEKFLSQCEKTHHMVAIILTVLRESRNFMRYSLFYVLAFARKEIELSYVLEEDDEINEPFYLLKLLELEEKGEEDDRLINLPMKNKENFFNELEKSKKVSKENKEIFSICPYKFWLTGGIHTKVIYQDEFQMRYLLSVYIQVTLSGEEKSHEEQMGIEKDIKELFPFWDQVIISDAMRKGRSQARSNKEASKDYKRRKKNFLVAQWQDQNTEKEYMDYEFDEQYYEAYMEQENTFMEQDKMPHQKICDLCHLESICLMDRYWGRTEEEVNQRIGGTYEKSE